MRHLLVVKHHADNLPITSKLPGTKHLTTIKNDACSYFQCTFDSKHHSKYSVFALSQMKKGSGEEVGKPGLSSCCCPINRTEEQSSSLVHFKAGRLGDSDEACREGRAVVNTLTLFKKPFRTLAAFTDRDLGMRMGFSRITECGEGVGGGIRGRQRWREEREKRESSHQETNKIRFTSTTAILP